MPSSPCCNHSGPVVITVAAQAPLSTSSGVLLFHRCGRWSTRREGWWSCSFFTSCISSHSFVDQGLPGCVLWPWHEGLCWNNGEISGTELDKRTCRFPLEDGLKKFSVGPAFWSVSLWTTFVFFSLPLRWFLTHESRWIFQSHWDTVNC